MELVTYDEDELVLTTMDNPYNPKTDYLKWRQFDIDNGYHTEEYLARLIDINDDVDIDDDAAMVQAINKAVNMLLENDTLNNYRLV